MCVCVAVVAVPIMLLALLAEHSCLCVCVCVAVAAVPIVALLATDTTTFVQGSLCLSGPGISREVMLSPTVQSLFKSVLVAHIDGVVSASIVFVTVDDVFIVSVDSCSNTGAVRRLTAVQVRRRAVC